ncbi:IS1634 family transposase [Methylacidiphilum fumariolicum]|uniref:IS1634 family transposase n=1 Tax=Candidatus Methylacidiphilum fumarolicum TaxID=591154 RepID=UPI001CA56EED|nr:IS1634 family transposase [Candidatus Methylacidiphilum fumarolicum]MBW6414507.1 IS1634 family transposase [Candidatus Methylacidiphilum fumarolicum]
MYLQEVRTRHKGKIYRSYIVRESYRVGKQVKTRRIANVTRLPEEAREVLAAALQKKRLVPVEGLEVQEALDYGGMAVLEEAWGRFDLDEVFASVGSERKQRLLKAMIFGRILFPSSKLALREEARGTLLAKVCGLEEKDLDEDELYRAMDELNGCWSGIEKKLYQGRQPQGASLVLYDLSSVYFEGEGPEGLAQYGYSRDHRQDRRQVLLAVATDGRGIPFHVEVLRGNRADRTTLTGLLVTLRRRFGIQEATFVFNGGMRSCWNLEILTGMELEYVTRSTRAKLQEILSRLPEDRQLWLMDRTRVLEIEQEGVRYVIAGGEWRAQRDRERRQSRIAQAEEVLRQITKAVRRQVNPVNLGSRVGRALQKLKAHKYFQYGVDAGGRFWWKLDQERVKEEEATDGWYLLETNLPATKASGQAVLTHYKQLAVVEAAFSELKSYLEVRPVYHWRPDRVRNHVMICFLAFWISARLGAEWVAKGFTEEVPKVLRRLQTIRLVNLSLKGQPLIGLFSQIPSELNALLQKIDLLSLFASPPKWAM